VVISYKFDFFDGMLLLQLRGESKHIKWRPKNIGIKQDWQDKFKNIRLGRKEAEDTDKVGDANMAIPFYDENLYILNVKNDLEAKVGKYETF
jgi:Rab3 GTPase-activating protein catalytic subunit